MANPTQPKATVLPFRLADRPAIPPSDLPLPPLATGPVPVEAAAPVVDLSGRQKVVFFCGRGRVGKTMAVRFVFEMIEQKGATPVVAACDPINRSLRDYIAIAEPPTNEPAEVRDWLLALLQHVVEQHTSAMVDMGGGDTALPELLKVMPDLPAVLTDGGVEPVAIYLVGPDPHDLSPLALAEHLGFQPRATAIVLNEGLGARGRFDRILSHPAYQAAIERGVVPIWMPAMVPDVASLLSQPGWKFLDLKGKGGPFVKSMVDAWVRRMTAAFAPIDTWWPE